MPATRCAPGKHDSESDELKLQLGVAFVFQWKTEREEPSAPLLTIDQVGPAGRYFLNWLLICPQVLSIVGVGPSRLVNSMPRHSAVTPASGLPGSRNTCT